MANNNHNEKKPGTTDSVAARVLGICKLTDANAQIKYVGRDEDDRTVVRIASSMTSSVSALQKCLATAMPLARVGTSENTLDGSMEAKITVPTRFDEWIQANGITAERVPLKLLWLLSVALLCVGVGMWLSNIVETTANVDLREI
tara:strand:+ start:454 stop:888 length:435 start_codon:yes stop_codon:yes gene_type:complete